MVGDKQRTWTVSYTARRKTTIYKRQTVTVEVTEQQLLDYYACDSIDELGGDLPEMQIEQIAVEHGDPAVDGWKTYLDEDEDLDEDHFEITEED